MNRARRLLGVGLFALLAACGKSGTAPSTPPTSTSVIRITSTGVTPKNIVVPRGTQVTFVNEDSRTHDMQSDPHPTHDDCPELRQVGGLQPGETRLTGNLNIAMTCGFHDNQNETNLSLTGSIVVQ